MSDYRRLLGRIEWCKQGLRSVLVPEVAETVNQHTILDAASNMVGTFSEEECEAVLVLFIMEKDAAKQRKMLILLAKNRCGEVLQQD